ncbi:unnamed protein product, partial [Didymodactylos carnosus]
KFSMIHLDDIIIFSKSYKEHIDHLNQVLIQLDESNPPKCEVAKTFDLHTNPVNPKATWSLQNAVAVILNRFLDKSFTLSRWTCGLDPLLHTYIHPKLVDHTIVRHLNTNLHHQDVKRRLRHLQVPYVHFRLDKHRNRVVIGLKTDALVAQFNGTIRHDAFH